MRSLRFLLPGLVALAALAALASCARQEPALTEAEAAAAERLGNDAADRLAGTLIRHLSAAIDSAGPAAAIEFCAMQAMPLTEEVNATLGGPVVKRTSWNVRNPANAPDSLERVAITWFEAEMSRSGAVPAGWLQSGRDEVRYYRPLVIGELCMHCHGPVRSLSDEVRAVLAERYPADEATGYRPGDLRGLIRVSIPRAALES